MARAASRLSPAFTTTGRAASTTREDLQAAKQTGYAFETPREIKLLPRTHENQKKKKIYFNTALAGAPPTKPFPHGQHPGALPAADLQPSPAG